MTTTKPSNEYFAEINEFVEVPVRVTYVGSHDTKNTSVFIARTPSGHSLQWFSEGRTKIALNDIVLVKGQVRAHRIFNGYHQCILRRVHASRVGEELTRPAGRKPRLERTPRGSRPRPKVFRAEEAWTAMVSGDPIEMRHVATLLGTSNTKLFDILRMRKVLEQIPGGGHKAGAGYEHLFWVAEIDREGMKYVEVEGDRPTYLKPYVLPSGMPTIARIWTETTGT